MATISDVAQRAGVSIAAVSYVLNGRADLVREETAERIRQAARELNYSASPVARSLATGSSYTVAIVLPDQYIFAQPVGSLKFLGIAEELYSANYSLLIKPSCFDDRHGNRIPAGIPGHVAGVLVLGPMGLDNPDLAQAIGAGKPVVITEDAPDDWGLTRVNADNYRAGVMVTEHLIKQGHKAIGLISRNRASACMTRRAAGYRDALADAGMEPNPDLMVDVAEVDADEITQATDRLIDCPLKPTALITLDGALLPAMSDAIDARGLTVPAQMAVGCVDYGLPTGFQVRWPVVSLIVDLRLQGELAARALIRMLRSKSEKAEDQYVAPELVVLMP